LFNPTGRLNRANFPRQAATCLDAVSKPNGRDNWPTVLARAPLQEQAGWMHDNGG